MQEKPIFLKRKKHPEIKDLNEIKQKSYYFDNPAAQEEYKPDATMYDIDKDDPNYGKVIYLEINFLANYEKRATALEYEAEIINVKSVVALDNKQQECRQAGKLWVYKSEGSQLHVEHQNIFSLTLYEIICKNLLLKIRLYTKKSESSATKDQIGTMIFPLSKNNKLNRGLFQQPLKIEQKNKTTGKAETFDTPYELNFSIRLQKSLHLRTFGSADRVLNVKLIDITKYSENCELAVDFAIFFQSKAFVNEADSQPYVIVQDKGFQAVSKRGQKSNVLKFDKHYDVNIDINLSKVKAYHRCQLHQFYLVFFLKYYKNFEERLDLGWYAHPLFKDGSKLLNTGQFEVRLWEKPQTIPSFPIAEEQQNKLKYKLSYTLHYQTKEPEAATGEPSTDQANKSGKGTVLLQRKGRADDVLDDEEEGRVITDKLTISIISLINIQEEVSMSFRIINTSNQVLKDESGAPWEFEIAREEPTNARIEVGEEITIDYDIDKLAEENKAAAWHFMIKVEDVNDESLCWFDFLLFDPDSNKPRIGNYEEKLFEIPIIQPRDIVRKKMPRTDTRLKFAVKVQ